MAKNFPINLRLGAVERVSGALKKTRDSLGKVGKAAQRTANKFKLLKEKTAGLRKALNKVGGGMKNIGKKMTTGVTMPIVGAGAAILMTAARFQKGMNKVKALTGAGTEDMKKMRDMAKQLGSKTQFSAAQAADAMAFLGMAGWKTNDILKGTPGLLDLAAASGTDLASAADIASNIMGQFNLKAEESGRVADILAATTAGSNVNMEQLAETMKQAGPNAFEFGATLEETAAAAGMLGNIGIQGSMAGTALKRAFAALGSPTGAAADALKAMGVQVADEGGNMRKFGDIMKDLAQNLGRFPQQTRLQAMQALFGNIGKTGASALARFAKSGEMAKFQESLENSEGKAKEMAKIMQEGAAGAVTKLKSALEGLAIAIADSGLLDTFTNIVTSITDWVSKMTETNPKLFKLGTIIAVVAAAAGPLLAIAGFMVTGFTAILPVIGLLSAKFILLAAIFGGAMYAGYKLVKNWKHIKQWAFDLADSVGNAFSKMWDKITDVFQKGLNWLKDKIKLIPAPVMKVLGAGGNLISGAFSSIKGLFSGSDAADRREERGAPSAFGRQSDLSRSVGTSRSIMEKKSKVEIEIKDKGGNAKVRANLGDDDIAFKAGLQGAAL